MTSTVRFSQVVEVAGKPQLHVLWGAPSSDAAFQRALKSGRVMTLRQNNVGTKKDFGLIGFSQESPAQFLIFPQSLKAFEGRRVVGINYEVFAPPPTRALSSRSAKRGKTKTSTVHSERANKPPAVRAPRLSKAAPLSIPPRTEVLSSEHSRPAAKTPTPKRNQTQPRSAAELDRPSILKEVKKAMSELEAGKAIPAFHRLEKLAGELSSHP